VFGESQCRILQIAKCEKMSSLVVASARTLRRLVAESRRYHAVFKDVERRDCDDTLSRPPRAVFLPLRHPPKEAVGLLLVQRSAVIRIGSALGLHGPRARIGFAASARPR